MEDARKSSTGNAVNEENTNNESASHEEKYCSKEATKVRIVVFFFSNFTIIGMD